MTFLRGLAAWALWALAHPPLWLSWYGGYNTLMKASERVQGARTFGPWGGWL